MIHRLPDLASRRKVWAELSLLYLDIDTDDVVDGAARELADSDYRMDELHSILVNEVHPILRTNLMVSAGVWQAFDQEWLGEQIVRRLARPRWLRAPSWFLSSMVKRIWCELAPRIERIRVTSPRVEVDGNASP